MILFLAGLFIWFALCLLGWVIVRGGSRRRITRTRISDGLMHQRMGRAMRPCIRQENGDPLMYIGTEDPRDK